ncbi:MAG: restriction endonuclease subunit S [Candidatus Eisenbacteria bacterium]|nr:restriction endonuclease subunit S [Candidatus Eisenbacteria bacterium]
MTWPRVRLGDVLQPVPRPVDVDGAAEYREIGIRSHGRGLFHKEPISGTALGEKKVFWVEPGDFVLNIVFAWEGAVGIVGEAETGMIGSHRFPTFRPDVSRLDTRFLLHYFRTKEGLDALLRVSPGGAGRNRTLSRNAFLNLVVPLPALPEQRSVVQQVEELERKIAEAARPRCLADASIAGAWERAAEDRLARVTATRPLGELVRLQGGGTPSKANPLYWSGSIPWVSPKDMKRWEIDDSEDHISVEATQESPAKLVKAGALLIVTRGMILVRTVPVGRLTVDATINQDMKALHAGDVDAEYLLFALRALNRGLLALVAKSTHDTRKLETDKLLSFPVPVPSRDEQVAIVAYLKRLRDTLAAASERAAAAGKELDFLARVALSRAFAPAFEKRPTSEAMAS